MKRRFKIFLSFVAIYILNGCDNTSFFGSYDKCILNNLKGVNVNEIASIRAVVTSCEGLYPDKGYSDHMRDLTTAEMDSINGWAKPKELYTDEFSGEIYNGNPKLIITKIKVYLEYQSLDVPETKKTSKDSKPKRTGQYYISDVYIPPYSVESIYIRIPKDFYNKPKWTIAGGKGVSVD